MTTPTPVRLDDGLVNYARGAIAGFQNLGESFDNLGGVSGFIGGDEPLDSLWLQEQRRIIYARVGTGDLTKRERVAGQQGGVYPRIELENVHYTEQTQVTFGVPEQVGQPKYEKVVRSTHILYPDSKQVVEFGNTESQTKSLSDAVTEGLELSLAEQFGYWSQPVGFETKQVARREIEHKSEYGSGDTNTVGGSHETLNPFDYPVTSNVTATRLIRHMRIDCVGHPDFDFGIRYFPKYGSLRNLSVAWRSKKEFLASMHGIAADDVGVLTTNWGTRSFSTMAKNNPVNRNLQLSGGDLPVYFTREFDEVHEKVDEEFTAIYDSRFHDKYPKEDIERFKQEGLIKE